MSPASPGPALSSAGHAFGILPAPSDPWATHPAAVTPSLSRGREPRPWDMGRVVRPAHGALASDGGRAGSGSPPGIPALSTEARNRHPASSPSEAGRRGEPHSSSEGPHSRLSREEGSQTCVESPRRALPRVLLLGFSSPEQQTPPPWDHPPRPAPESQAPLGSPVSAPHSAARSRVTRLPVRGPHFRSKVFEWRFAASVPCDNDLRSFKQILASWPHSDTLDYGL